MKVIVLAYHRVYPGYHITPDTFEFQIKVLKENFIPLMLDEVIAFLKGDLRLEKDGFAITFDDGWVDNFIYAYPILEKYKIKATLFVTPNFISERPLLRPTLIDYWNGRLGFNDLLKTKNMDEAIFEFASNYYSDQFLSWLELNEMKNIFDVESQGYSHAYHFISNKIVTFFKEKPVGRQNWLLLSDIKYSKGAPVYEMGSVLAYPKYYEDNNTKQMIIDYLNKNPSLLKNRNMGKILRKQVVAFQRKSGYKNSFENGEGFRKRVGNELRHSIESIRKYMGTTTKYIAWPFGEYNGTLVNIAKEIGFDACYTTHQGFVYEGNNCYELKRFSPPRNRKLFLSAISGKLGMSIFQGLLLFHPYSQRFRNLILGEKVK